ncbi:hypothetical protein NECAME_09157 [Necator americanus]|uniref:Uncharacterized protein n=1 Tax=Necator americanus TaxID=51031 RepID=W2TFW3_NECAM|nr:hypothetical protein NECAME_09157 [Necator americanus]ETN80484.1 hypothetical protein NECAME_09157 [Necator americanus]
MGPNPFLSELVKFRICHVIKYSTYYYSQMISIKDSVSKLRDNGKPLIQKGKNRECKGYH